MISPLSFALAAADARGSRQRLTKIPQDFGINLPSILAQMVSFARRAFVLWKFAFKPVLATLDERQQKIASGLQYAEEMKAKLEAAQQASDAQLKEAQVKAQRHHRRGPEGRQGISPTSSSRRPSSSPAALLAKAQAGHRAREEEDARRGPHRDRPPRGRHHPARARQGALRGRPRRYNEAAAPRTDATSRCTPFPPMAAHAKKAQQLARQLFKLSVADGVVSAERVAGVLAYVEKHRPANPVMVLKAYQRLSPPSSPQARRVVEHAGAITDASPAVAIAAALTQKYGRTVTATAPAQPALLAGLRVRVGDDIYESSVAGQLAALAAAV